MLTGFFVLTLNLRIIIKTRWKTLSGLTQPAVVKLLHRTPAPTLFPSVPQAFTLSVSGPLRSLSPCLEYSSPVIQPAWLSSERPPGSLSSWSHFHLPMQPPGHLPYPGPVFFSSWRCLPPWSETLMNLYMCLLTITYCWNVNFITGCHIPSTENILWQKIKTQQMNMWMGQWMAEWRGRAGCLPRKHLLSSSVMPPCLPAR